MAEISILGFSSLGLIFFITVVSISANVDGNDGIAFERNIDPYLNFLAYSFLAMFFIMSGSNIFLALQTRAKNNRRTLQSEMRLSASLRKEKVTLGVIFFFFALSYGLRFVFVGFISPKLMKKKHDYFLNYILYALLTAVEGLAFMAILLNHR